MYTDHNYTFAQELDFDLGSLFPTEYDEAQASRDFSRLNLEG